MKKYRITKQISSGIPFTLRDNEFYKNEFVLSANCIKLKIEKRSRKEWKILRLQDI